MTRGVSESEGCPLHTARTGRATSTEGSTSMLRERVKESGSVIGTVPSADRTAVTSGCGTIEWGKAVVATLNVSISNVPLIVIHSVGVRSKST